MNISILAPRRFSISFAVVCNVLCMSMIAGCGSKGKGAAEDDLSEAAQAVSDVVSGIDDNGGQSSFALANEGDQSAMALGDACSAATFNSCGTSASQTMVKTYSSCTTAAGYLMSGTVTLKFSEASCTMPVTGSPTVTRMPDLTLTGRRGATLRTTGTSHLDYRGVTISGGQRLTRTGSTSFTYDVLGVHRTLTTSSGSLLADVSTRTIAAIAGSGLTRSGRTLSSGTIEVIHNIAHYVATWTLNSLTWGSSTCACPTSGNLSVSITGNVTATGSLSFGTTCGTGVWTVNGQSGDIKLDGC